MSAGSMPSVLAAAATPSALAALCRPAVRRRADTGPASASRPWISSVVVAGRVSVTRPRSVPAGPARGPEALRDRPRVAADPLRRLIDERVRDDAARPVRAAARRPPRRLRPRRWRRGSRPSGGAVGASLERIDDGGAIGEHVGVVPLGAGEDRDVRPVRVEVAGVFVRLDDERRSPAPARRRRAVRPSRTPAAGRRRTPMGRRRPSARTWTSQPAVVLLPCVPATPTSVRPTAASATTCCHGSIGMPARARPASSGWSGSIAVSAFVTARRSGRGRA